MLINPQPNKKNKSKENKQLLEPQMLKVMLELQLIKLKQEVEGKCMNRKVKKEQTYKNKLANWSHYLMRLKHS